MINFEAKIYDIATDYRVCVYSPPPDFHLPLDVVSPNTWSLEGWVIRQESDFDFPVYYTVFWSGNNSEAQRQIVLRTSSGLVTLRVFPVHSIDDIQTVLRERILRILLPRLYSDGNRVTASIVSLAESLIPRDKMVIAVWGGNPGEIRVNQVLAVEKVLLLSHSNPILIDVIETRYIIDGLNAHSTLHVDRKTPIVEGQKLILLGRDTYVFCEFGLE